MPLNVLSQIANPTVANIPEAFARGQQISQQQQIGRDQLARGQQQQQIGAQQIDINKLQLAGGRRQELQDTDDALAKELSYDVLSSFAIGPGANRDKILANALRKSPANSASRVVLQDVFDTPEGRDREAKLIRIMDAARDQGFLPGKSKPTQFQKTGAFLVRDPETGGSKIATGVFDPTTGKLRTETSPEGLEIVSKLGETPIEQTERKIGQTEGQEQVKKKEQRSSELISRGVLAAESVAGLNRGLELLNSVKTGGFRAAANRAKELFGIQSADEGELSNRLSKAVLSQLRETFGAAFTENEGKRLERIEGSFTKSTEGNKRLLSQALKMATKTAKRAKKAALKSGDTDTAEDIDDLLQFSLSNTPEKVKNPATNDTATPPPQVLNFDAQGNLIQ